MRQLLFMGVENEFIPYRDGAVHDTMIDEWEKLFLKYPHPCFRKTDSCIRTRNGSSVYLDIDEPETCTSPVLIERGFATKLRDALHNARHDLLEYTAGDKKLNLVGYSMHWNITWPDTVPEIIRHRLTTHFGVPWQMFALTPHSGGSNIRERPGRIEFLADHLPGEEQARAFALLYAATIIGAHDHVAPYSIICGAHISNIINGGRDTKITAMRNRHLLTQEFEATVPITVSAQQYLEETVRAFKDVIKTLASKEEYDLLDRFVNGKERLEIDKHDEYQKKSVLRTDDTYLDDPSTRLNKRSYRTARALTAMGRFLGAVAHQDMPRPMPKGMEGFPSKINKMEWTHIDTENWDIRELGTIQFVSEVTKGASFPDVNRIILQLADANGFTNSHAIYHDLKSIQEQPVVPSREFNIHISHRVPDVFFEDTKDEDVTIGTDGLNTRVTLSRAGSNFIRAYERLYKEKKRKRTKSAQEKNAANDCSPAEGTRTTDARRSTLDDRIIVEVGARTERTNTPAVRLPFDTTSMNDLAFYTGWYSSYIHHRERMNQEPSAAIQNELRAMASTVFGLDASQAMTVLSETANRSPGHSIYYMIYGEQRPWTPDMSARALQEEILRRANIGEEYWPPAQQTPQRRGAQNITYSASPIIAHPQESIRTHHDVIDSICELITTRTMSDEREDAEDIRFSTIDCARDIHRIRHNSAIRVLEFIDDEMEFNPEAYCPGRQWTADMPLEQLREEIFRRVGIPQEYWGAQSERGPDSPTAVSLETPSAASTRGRNAHTNGTGTIEQILRDGNYHLPATGSAGTHTITNATGPSIEEVVTNRRPRRRRGGNR